MMKPNADITRQEVFVILSRAMKIESETTLNETFWDASSIDEWAKPTNAIDKTIIWSLETINQGTAIINSTSGLLTATGLGKVRVIGTNQASGIVGSLEIEIILPSEASVEANRFEFGLFASIINTFGLLANVSETAVNDKSKIEIIGNGSIRGKEGSSMKFDDFADIITPNVNSLLLYEGAKIKVGDTQYIGDNKAIIQLYNYDGSSSPVAGFFLNGDKLLLLVIFEKAIIEDNTDDILDINLLVKAGENGNQPGELNISGFNIIKDSGENITHSGGIFIEANGTLNVNGESIQSVDDQNSFFNATGGDIDNRRGIRFTQEEGLILSIRRDVIMNKPLPFASIYSGGHLDGDSPATLDIRFDPEVGDFNLNSWEEEPIRGKFFTVGGGWTMHEIDQSGNDTDQSGTKTDLREIEFVNDPDVIGIWESIDFVRAIDDFAPLFL